MYNFFMILMSIEDWIFVKLKNFKSGSDAFLCFSSHHVFQSRLKFEKPAYYPLACFSLIFVNVCQGFS